MDQPAKTILVIEDEEDLRDFMTIVLSRAGYRVVEAKDGREALHDLEVAHPDLILFDLKMPVMNGREFVEEYRRRFMRQVPLIVMTAADDARHRADAIGVDGLLVKPFGVAALVEEVARRLR